MSSATSEPTQKSGILETIMGQYFKKYTNKELKPSYVTLEKVFNLKNSPACKKDKICAFNDYNTQFVFELSEEPNLNRF